jgi:beta-galactosidase
MPVKVRYNGLEVDGNLVPMLSGAVHYWRLDPMRWETVLDKVKALGFPMIETYVPWSVHELSPGEFDFGRLDQAKNLDRFLSLAEEKGLKIILRPGPQINAELPDFGYPRRVLDGERFWSRDSFGAACVVTHCSSQFCAPSYASEELLNEFEPFLAALAPVIQKHLHPHGGVLALQVDNEAGYFGRPGTYDHDYSDASLKLYRHFLELKYRQLKAISEAYGSKQKSFEELEPPRVPELETLGGLRRSLDWAEYKEYQLTWFLSKAAELFKSKGLGGVPFFHNYYGAFDTPFNLSDVEKDSGLEFCGLDSYQHAPSAGASLDQARYLSSSSLLAYFPEFGSGAWPTKILARNAEDHAAHMLAGLMGGGKGMNFYMLVERDRWVGSPISAEGHERPELAGLFSRFNHFFAEQEWIKASPQNAAVLLDSRELQMLEAAALRPGEMADRDFFPRGFWRKPLPKALLNTELESGAAREFLSKGRQWLKLNSFSYALGDSSISTDKLKKHAFAIATAWGYLDEAYAKRLKAFVESGGYLVLGPEIPKFNSRFEKLAAWADLKLEHGKPLSLGDGKLLWLSHFDDKAVSAFIRKGKVIPELSLSDTSLDLAIHKVGGRSVLFVRNPHPEERPCTVAKEGKFVLKPLWSSGKFLGAVEERDVKLGPHEIKVWELIPC